MPARSFAAALVAVTRALALLLVLPGVVVAQSPTDSARPRPGRGVVRGVVFDSLVHAPLAGATVVVVGTPALAITDSAGQFDLREVPVGRRLVAYSHPALDSIGLTSPGAVVDVREGEPIELALATPSLGTLQLRLCGTTLRRRGELVDSGIVFGVVSDADAADTRVAGARVAASWLKVKSLSAERGISIETPAVIDTTDDSGAYRACGIPTGIAIDVEIEAPPFTAGPTEVVVDGRRPIVRHDVLVARATASAAAPDSAGALPRPAARGRAHLAGVVRDTGGVALPHARVALLAVSDAPIVVGETGRFEMSALPSGSYTLEVRALGFGLMRRTVHLRSGDTTRVELRLDPARSLREVRVTAQLPFGRDREGFERRRRTGAGYYRSADELRGIGTLGGVFAGIPGVRYQSAGLRTQTLLMRAEAGMWCEPNVVIDGWRSDIDQLLQFFQPGDLAAIEVYPRGMTSPAEYFRGTRCGLIVAWTKESARW